MKKYSIIIVLIALFTIVSISVTKNVVNTISTDLSKDSNEIASEFESSAGWRKQQTNKNDRIPEGITISTKEQDGIKAIRIDYNKNEPIKLKLGGKQSQQLDNCPLDFIYAGIENNASIKFDGPGMVSIANIKTAKTYKIGDTVSFSANQGYSWIPGTFLGIFGGIFGIAAGILVPKGKGKKVVIILGAIGILYSLSLLIIGLVYMAYGEGWFLWYPFLLPGVIGVAVFIPNFIVLFRRYQDFELRRMKAIDSLDSIL